MSSAIGTVGSSFRAVEAASLRNSRVPAAWSGSLVSSFATEWAITDGWLRAAVTPRRTVSTARARWDRYLSRLSRCQIGDWLQTMIPARSSLESSRSFRR
jgi:hypothetical protein